MIDFEEKFDLISKYSTYIPPKTQLLKWVGNKHKFAPEITRHFPRTFNRYFEPFLGSGAVLATLKPSKGIGSDTFAPLIEIWNKLKNDPKGLISWYKHWHDQLSFESKEM